MADDAAYRVLSQVHKPQWDERLNAAVQGWEVRILWRATGTIIPIFVDDEHYDEANVDALARSAGARVEAVHRLGG